MSKWTPERLKKDRESWEAKNNSRTTNRTASTGTAAGTANTTDKWTPERAGKLGSEKQRTECCQPGCGCKAEHRHGPWCTGAGADDGRGQRPQAAAGSAAGNRQNTGISGQKRHCDRQRYRYTQQHCAAGMAEREEHCSSGGKGDGNGADH